MHRKLRGFSILSLHASASTTRPFSSLRISIMVCIRRDDNSSASGIQRKKESKNEWNVATTSSVDYYHYYYYRCAQSTIFRSTSVFAICMRDTTIRNRAAFECLDHSPLAIFVSPKISSDGCQKKNAKKCIICLYSCSATAIVTRKKPRQNV